MKRFKYAAIIVLIFSIPLLTNGCLYYKVHSFGLESNAKSMDYSQYEDLGIAEGVSSSYTMFWIIPVTDDATFDEAISEAIRSKGADNLIAVTKWRERKISILGTIDILHVKGTAIRYIRNATK